MTWYIHINRNLKGSKEPIVRFQRGKYGKPTYCYEVAFDGGRVVYDPDNPILPCGARLVIETETEPRVIR